MASGGVPYEEHFWCCICLDLFSSPVTLPCGHNFCKACISQHWRCSQTRQCPLCKEQCPHNTELRVNSVLAQMSQELRSAALDRPTGGEGRGVEGEAEGGGVWCDVCMERRAEKSCVTCLASFCEVHLKPHYRSEGLRRHRLIDPASDLEQRTCRKHNRPLRFFCQSDQACVCQFCSESDHSRHPVVSLEQGGREKRRELSQIQDKMAAMASERRAKMGQLQRAAQDGEDKMAENTRDCVQAVFKVTWSLEKGLSQLLDSLESKQSQVTALTEGFVSQLEEEICKLLSARIDLEERKNTNDDFKLIQDFESLRIPPETQDLSKVEVQTFQRSVVEKVVKEMSETVERLDTFWKEAELRCAQEFAANVTLDAKTAYPALVLSDNCKQVKCGDEEKNIPDCPERFTKHIAVLGKQFVDSGKFYFEVRVGGKASWDVGVVSESIDRKDAQIVSPENGYFVIWLRGGKEYHALTAQASVRLNPRSKPQSIGVFVDYDKSVVAFYNSETAEKIHSFEKCEFEGRLYPYFSPGVSDGQSLIITEVNDGSKPQIQVPRLDFID